jgi:hypothetical protein
MIQAANLEKKHENDFRFIEFCRMWNLDKNDFVTCAKPMSMFGSEDEELAAVINEIRNHFV